MKKLLLLVSLVSSLCSATPPTLYESSTENVQDIPITRGIPYMFFSPYTVIVPNLNPCDVIHITSRAEVTNYATYPVMVGWYLSNTWAYGTTNNPPYVAMPPVTQDIIAGSPGGVHFVPSVDVWATGYSGTTVFALILYAAASAGPSSGAYLNLEHGYGKIQVAVFKYGQ